MAWRSRKTRRRRETSHTSGCDGRKSANNTKTEVVVGWPPVCSYRRKKAAEISKMYVKVSMDSVPFLRKIYLNSHSGYKDLITAFHKLFSCDKMSINEERDGSEYIPIYDDKDGDWMLVGDVPVTLNFSSTSLSQSCTKSPKMQDVYPIMQEIKNYEQVRGQGF